MRRTERVLPENTCIFKPLRSQLITTELVYGSRSHWLLTYPLGPIGLRQFSDVSFPVSWMMFRFLFCCRGATDLKALPLKDDPILGKGVQLTP